MERQVKIEKLKACVAICARLMSEAKATGDQCKFWKYYYISLGFCESQLNLMQ